jgi:hypothetical protein
MNCKEAGLDLCAVCRRNPEHDCFIEIFKDSIEMDMKYFIDYNKELRLVVKSERISQYWLTALKYYYPEQYEYVQKLLVLK